MIGKELSPVLEEMEATLWEYEAFNGAKPNYTLEGFRASTKIFMSALLDKFFEKQQAEGVSQEDTLKAVEKLGQDVRALIDEPDTFARNLPVFTTENWAVKAEQCEEYGWPNTTHTGRIMYENTYFRTRAEAYADLLKDTKNGIKHRWIASSVQDALRKLRRAIWLYMETIGYWVAARTIGRFIMKRSYGKKRT